MEVADLHRARKIADRRRLVRSSAYADAFTRGMAGHGRIDDEVRNAFSPYRPGMKAEDRAANVEMLGLLRERRELSGGAGPTGGWLMPESWSSQIGDLLRATSWVERLCRVWMLSEGDTMNCPSLESTGPAQWLERHAPVTRPSHSFGRSQIVLSRLETSIRYSRDLAAASGAFQSSISELLADAIAAGLERGVLAGGGGIEPVGLLNDTNIPTVGASTDLFVSGGIASAKASLPARTHNNLSAVMHPVIKAKLELEAGSAVEYRADGCFYAGVRLEVSDYAPSAPAIGEAFAIVGDFRRGYGVVRHENVFALPLTEPFAETSEILSIVGTRVGAGLLTPAALRRVVRK